MSILSENLRYLRAQTKLSQQKVADALLISRGAYEKYESAHAQPPNDTLVRISRYFKVSIDLLLTLELRKYPLESLMKLSDNRILLPITVDSTGENKIQIVPYKAQMGYVNGFSDPEYIGGLQHISLPFLRNGIYRGFPAEGDSMPPFKDGTYIIGKYVEQISEMKVGKNYLLITRGGFVYKKLTSIEENSIWVKSDNTYFEPYEISAYDLLQVWEYQYSLLKDYDILDFTDNSTKEMFLSIKQDLNRIEKHLKP
ncbi:MAG: LexA family transcriptional regulator [Chryseobacterium sp.]|uniref:XRE family transcriptional regulator n=1 Tax=Chryseobacterium sp. G0201 TaxID=2487065 RepID=UPI000F51099E|nr:LexA family transcriptional regulator [Chryseobacterium sp. G0201]AZA54531.1 LexA family transcriptional regulator [Chryseobacterium sp. G0201]MDN5395102.1 LexA family transcriptional regulator [Chryseobacterium sp.]MDN5477818.1 LexA family transcriptional regulator [Chryseobacterium sp.]